MGLDPAYYTPIETSDIAQDTDSAEDVDPKVDELFFRSGMGLYVQANERRKGFVFTQIDEGTKAFNVDISSGMRFQTFTFFVPVPGLRVDHYEVDWEHLYPADEYRDVGSEELIEYLESQTCCTTDKKAEGSGDPLNIVVIGTPDEVYAAFIRAGWDETETIYGGSSWKTVKSFVGGGEYRYSPVSALFFHGRGQDVAFQKARSNIHERNHLRLWMTPLTFEGKNVWIGQISRDIGVRFTKKTITTHKIDPDVDETREYLLENLAYAQSLLKVGYVEGVGEVPIEEPKGNLTGDPWFSDGYRVVLWVSAEPQDLHELELLQWRAPPIQR